MSLWSSWSPTQQQAGKQIYSGFYNYALGQGADQSTATEFANLGLGTAISEGLNPAAPSTNALWGPTGDQGRSYGPFQLLTGGGLGDQLRGDFSPSNQIDVAASTMWGDPGTGGFYNTSPWFGPGDQWAGHGLQDTITAQNGAIDAGASAAQQYGFSPQTSGDFPTTNPDAGSLPATGQIGGSIEYAPDQSSGTDIGLPSGTEGFGQAGQGVSGSPVGIPDTPNQGSGAFGSNPLTQMGIGGASGDQSTPFGTGPTPGGSDQSAGAPVDITDISAAGGKGAGPQIQSGLNQAGQDVSKTGQALDQTLTSNTQSAESTGTGWFQYVGNLLFNLLPRFSVGVLAIVLIGLGIWLMGIEQRRSA